MIWEVGSDDITPVQPTICQVSLVGLVSVYRIGGKTLIETSEMVGMPNMPNKLMEKKFRDLVLEPLLVQAGIEVAPFKLRILKQKTYDVRFNRPKHAVEEPKKPLVDRYQGTPSTKDKCVTCGETKAECRCNEGK